MLHRLAERPSCQVLSGLRFGKLLQRGQRVGDLAECVSTARSYWSRVCSHCATDARTLPSVQPALKSGALITPDTAQILAEPPVSTGSSELAVANSRADYVLGCVAPRGRTSAVRSRWLEIDTT
jgi:hypothetical protein